MWFERQVVIGSAIGELIKPLFIWVKDKVIKPDSEQWRFDLAKWAMDPWFTVMKPQWFTKLVVTLCTEPPKKDEPPK